MTEEKKDRYRMLLAQKVLFYDRNNDNFLLAKVRNEKGWYYKNMGPWEFLGGGVDESETLEESLKREIAEEIGKDARYKILDVVDVNEYAGTTGQRAIIVYLAEYLGGELRSSEEHSEFKWVGPEEIEKSSEYKKWLKTSVSKAVQYVEREKYLDSWKRCQADFENHKKDQVKHQEEFRKYAKADVIEQILPALDNFEVSLAHVPEAEKKSAWVIGITHIKRQIEDILKNNDLEEVVVKSGDKFNPEIHEAVAGKGEKITKILQKGYKLNGRTVRAARVEVE